MGGREALRWSNGPATATSGDLRGDHHVRHPGRLSCPRQVPRLRRHHVTCRAAWPHQGQGNTQAPRSPARSAARGRRRVHRPRLASVCVGRSLVRRLVRPGPRPRHLAHVPRQAGQPGHPSLGQPAHPGTPDGRHRAAPEEGARTPRRGHRQAGPHRRPSVCSFAARHDALSVANPVRDASRISIKAKRPPVSLDVPRPPATRHPQLRPTGPGARSPRPCRRPARDGSAHRRGAGDHGRRVRPGGQHRRGQGGRSSGSRARGSTSSQSPSPRQAIVVYCCRPGGQRSSSDDSRHPPS